MLQKLVVFKSIFFFALQEHLSFTGWFCVTTELVM